MKKFRFTAVLLSLAIASGASLGASAELSGRQLECPDYSQIKSQEFDASAFEDAAERLEKIAENPDGVSGKEVLKNVQKLIDEYTHIYTLNNVYSIELYSDVTNNSAYERLTEVDTEYIEAYNTISDCIIALYDAGFEDILRNINGYDMISIFTYIDSEEDYSESNKENDQLLIEINELINEYMSYTEDDFSVEYGGKTWVSSDLFEETFYSEDELAIIAEKISSKRNEILGNLYLQLLQKRHRIAQNSGYDNYADFAYENTFIRDYSLDDTEEIYDTVKEKFSDLNTYAYDQSSHELNRSGMIDRSFDEMDIMNIMSEFLKEFDEGYFENFNHMKAHHLYDISNSENKSGDSFTASLCDYSVPFMFISPSGDFGDVSAVAHEFGHSNAEYEIPSSAIWALYGNSLDTCEMHSQGMEIMLASSDISTLSKDENNAFLKYTVYNLIHSLIQGCLFDEFQKYAYEHPNCTLDELNAEYSRLCGEYGVDYSPENYYEYDWVEISHNFDSPMYYISYAASAVSVMDLWLENMENPDNARNIYKDLVSCDIYTPYMTAAEYCGLATIFDEEALNELSYQLAYYFENDEIDPDYTPLSAMSIPSLENDNREFDDIDDFLDYLSEDEYELNQEDFSEDAKKMSIAMVIITFLPMIAAGVIWLIGVIIVIVVIKRSDKKKQNQTKDNDNELM